jgi:hypothetical protein
MYKIKVLADSVSAEDPFLRDSNFLLHPHLVVLLQVLGLVLIFLIPHSFTSHAFLYPSTVQ